MPSTSSSQSTRSTPAPSSSPATEQSRQRSTTSSTSASGASPTPAVTPSSLHWDRQTIQFFVNAWIFVVAVLAIFPFVPRNLANKAY
ncbi:hypothetical protein GIB67_009784 [Kingdonia uniflora]|uniref:Uncharacterized protein n=1 Tax=Kingdonia uniflora TaxID=39325 RepID=A0A7J7LXC0_9MAGN|nr:hypothetical protein GIB67_009784 [Kingdonia uniflora]